MRYLYIKDKKNRQNFNKNEKYYIIFKYFLLKSKINLYLLNDYFYKKKIYFFVRFKNCCIFTYKFNSVYTNFRLNRSLLRDLIVFGNICGFKKSSW